MNRKATLIHVVICVLIGGIVAYFSKLNWLAVSLWTSAAMFINGSLAMAEDALPGGFDNPQGTQPSPLIEGKSASRFALQSLAITTALVTAGFLMQFYL